MNVVCTHLTFVGVDMLCEGDVLATAELAC